MLVYRNGNRNSVNLYPSMAEVMTVLQEEYNHSWYKMQTLLCIEEDNRNAVEGVLMGTPFKSFDNTWDDNIKVAKVRRFIPAFPQR